ncbi:MAG: TonB-dependent receptor domain-containing protein [Bacteroidales bacterium]
MKILRIPVLCTLLIIPLLSNLNAQDNGSLIKGTVFNPDKEPAEYSTVVLMNQDSVFMSGTLSGPDGAYQFESLGGGTYFIMVRNVEFNTYVSPPIALKGNDVFELDPIHLEIRVNDLEEVVIKGEKAMVEVHPDKMVYNVSASVNASGNNALELLSKSPGVMVDMDKNIIVQGKSGVQIYINGRPSRISGSDLTNMLEGMRSEDIESIEVISNPSAKYDAEGTGGIINIVLKKNLARGFNGNLIGSYSRGVQSRSSLGTSLNYSSGKINLFSSLNVNSNDYVTDRNENMLREDYELDMISANVNSRKGLNFSGGLDYNISNEHSLSFDARVLINDNHGALDNSTYVYDINEILDPELLVARTLDSSLSQNYSTNLHYAFTPNRSSSLTADVSFGYYTNPNHTWQPNAYFDVSGNDLLRTVESAYNSRTDIRLFSAMVDYEKRFGKFTLSAGAKYSYISTDNSLDYYNIENEVSVPDTTRSNDFSYLEEVAAAYAILNYKPIDRITINAGLRVENTSSLGELVSAVPTPDDVVARNYTDLFPNVSVSYNDNANHALSLSFGRRITRPNYQNLNPFEYKLSELSAWRGNPFLEPNYITNYQVTYSFKRKLVISNTYSITKNYFANIFEAVGDKGVVVIPRNMEKATNNGLSVSYPQKVFKWWQFSSFLLYNYSTYKGDIEGTLIDLKAHIVNFRLQNDIRLPLDISMELSYYITSPWIWRGSLTIEGNQRINIGLKRQFFNERILLQVTANDLFNTGSTYYYSGDYGGMVIDGDIFFDGRRFGVNLTYNFGNQEAKKASRRKSAIDDELNRISE